LKPLRLAKLLATLFLLLAAAGVICLWFAGGNTGRWAHRSSVTIDRPTAEVFPWLHEPERMKRWMTGFQETRILTEGGLRVGARSIDVIESGGERYEMETEITALEQNRLLTARIVHESFTSLVSYELEELDGRTTVTYSCETRFAPFFLRILAPLIGRAAANQLEQSLANLRSVIEAS